MTTTSGVLAVALFLAFVNERVIEYITRPIFDNNPQYARYKWTLFYIALTTGTVLGAFSHLNLFLELAPPLDPVIGQILTSVIVGGGSSLLHDLFPERT